MEHFTVSHNFASDAAGGGAASSSSQQPQSSTSEQELTVIQWNIERGTEFDAIVANLRRQAGDTPDGNNNNRNVIFILQELDINCARSNHVNVPLKLAQALECNIVFAPEFEEFHCATRSKENSVGAAAARHVSDIDTALPPDSPVPRALHGNAVMTRLPIVETALVEHDEGIDWRREGVRLKEPRVGKRVSVGACVQVDASTRVWCYTVHTEVFAGASVRVATYRDVVRAAVRTFAAAEEETRGDGVDGVDAGAPQEQPQMAVIIGGDLNTMANGVVRLSPKYANDRLRFTLPPWLTEAEVFDFVAFRSKKSWAEREILCKLLLGLSEDTIRAFESNPLQLTEPFDLVDDVTLDHPGYRVGGGHWVRGKYDWLIHSNKGGVLKPLSKNMFNHLAGGRSAGEGEDPRVPASDHVGLKMVFRVKQLTAAEDEEAGGGGEQEGGARGDDDAAAAAKQREVKQRLEDMDYVQHFMVPELKKSAARNMLMYHFSGWLVMVFLTLWLIFSR